MKERNKEKLKNLTALFISLSGISLVAVLSYRWGRSDQLSEILNAVDKYKGASFDILESDGRIKRFYKIRKITKGE